MANLTAAWAYVRANGVGIGVEVLVNFVGPFLIYDFTKASLGDANALLASSGPPIAWSIVEFVRKRRVDALSMLVLAGIALSLLAFLGGGGVRFLQLREKLVTAAIGLIFLGSAAIGRPLIYHLARATSMRRSSSEAQELEALRDNVYFRRTMMVMTLVWGLGLVTEAAVASALVFALSIRGFLVVSPVIGYSTMGALGLWTAWYARRQRRLGAARQAAADAAAAEAPAA
ncbi:MAG: VC0807 family protein [Caulobacterales bacterium]